jgi:hypothetical protein
MDDKGLIILVLAEIEGVGDVRKCPNSSHGNMSPMVAWGCGEERKVSEQSRLFIIFS